MTGKIELTVKIGRTKDSRYDSYPYWGIKVTGENNNKCVFLTPTKRQVEKFLRDIIVHEMRVDLTRDRKPDVLLWKERFKGVLEESQKIIKDFDIPKIYKIPKLKEENHETR